MPRNFLLTWSAVGALIFLLIIILPFIARILWQNIQKLLTELHLIIKKKKKWGDARSQREECRLGQRSCGGRLGIRKGVIKPQDTPVPGIVSCIWSELGHWGLLEWWHEPWSSSRVSS